MGLYHSPKIATSGLVLALDAANAKSYSGSGTAWNDMSGSGFNGTLTNSPTYSSNNGGYFTFDGVNDNAPISGTLLSNKNTCTILMWIYNNAATQPSAGLFYSRGTSPNISGLAFEFTGTKLSWTWNADAATYNYDTTLTIPTFAWSMVGMSVGATSTTFWVNTSTNTQTYTPANQTLSSFIVGWDTWNSSRYFKGNIATTSFYNRALSTSEVLQYYNAFRGRYGI